MSATFLFANIYNKIFQYDDFKEANDVEDII